MTLVSAGISGLAGFMTAMWIRLVWRVGRVAALTSAAGILVVAGVQLALAANGTLTHWDRMPPPFLILLAVTFALTIGLALSPIGARVAAISTVSTLAIFQIFRLPLELVMHRAALAGIMPMQMTYTGWNFDILTGSTAILVAAIATLSQPPRWLIVGWNLMGSILLLAIIAIAVASTPPIAAFGSSPERLNTWVAYQPFVWLPGVLVQAALFGHIVLWRKLLR